MQQGLKDCCDMGHRLFLNSTWDMGDNKQHCHFLKSTCNIGYPPSRAPIKRVYQFVKKQELHESRNWVCHGSKLRKEVTETSLNVDSLIGSKLPKIESTCLTTIIG